MSKLSTIQNWMLTAITHPLGLESGVASARSELHSLETLEEIILPSQACSAFDRLNVYGRAYFARLAECLEAEFPAFRHAVGDDAFASFVLQYLAEHPPSSTTLADLGARFPAFLRATSPQANEHGEPDSWAEFLVELASLERLYSEVFDGAGEEGEPALAPDAVMGISVEDWPNARLVCSASLRLLEMPFPVHLYATAVRRQESPPPCEPAKTWLAVHRHEYVVRRRTLTQEQFRLLSLLQSGVPIATALERSLASSGLEDAELARQLQNWFSEWTAAGLFRRIATGS